MANNLFVEVRGFDPLTKENHLKVYLMNNQGKEVFANTKTSNRPKVTKIVRTNSMNTSINRRDLLQALKVIRTKGKTNTEKMTALNNINGSDWIGYMETQTLR